MTRKVQIVKKKVAPPSTFGTNPNDPWSTAKNLAEHGDKVASGILAKFLASRGINPKFVTKNMRISHAKSDDFKRWRNNHLHLNIGEGLQLESKNVGDIISFDIPLLIKVLELAREDVKTDSELHKITERLIEIRNKGTLTMAEFDYIAGLKKKIQEKIQESKDDVNVGDHVYIRHPKESWTTLTGKVHSLHGDSHVNVTILGGHYGKPGEVHQFKRKDVAKGFTTLNPKIYREETCDTGGFDPSSQAQEDQPRIETKSKGYKLLKDMKKKVVKEDLLDTEKMDKSEQTYGKKPIHKVAKIEDSFGDKKPAAAAILTGGTTLTGQPRDDVEIDPVLRNRPGQPDAAKATGTQNQKQDKNLSY